MLRRFLENHVLANLTFVLIIVLGSLTFLEMPRARDPDINFNWVSIRTVLPGASSIEIEKRITDPIEDRIASTVKDLKFVSSTSRDSISSIVVRFNQLSEAEFDKRMTDLRREVQNVYNDRLPEEAIDPSVTEITTSSGFPTAVLAIKTASFDYEFRRYVERITKDIERIQGVDSTTTTGLEDAELLIEFFPERLLGLGITPADLSDTVSAYFSDVSMGDVETSTGKWVVRLQGTERSLDDLASFPIPAANGVVTLGEVATIYRSWAEAGTLASLNGEPAVIVGVTKQEGVNILAILSDLRAYLDHENEVSAGLGYELVLIDDQTISTREAIDLMQNNALIGLVFVVVVAFLFLGGHISFLTSIGIPFTLAGTFIVLAALDMSVNNSVLLGVVIALGMIVDDAVVVVEAIYYRIQRGEEAMDAAIGALQEVFAPVLTSVLTTISVFLPLMLLPGIIGELMRVIPIVVCVALAVSLLEAFWILPAHVSFIKVDLGNENTLQKMRRRATRKIRHGYSLLLCRALRHPWLAFLGIFVSFAFAVVLMASGAVRVNFFASDPFKVFYVNVELPQGTPLEKTLAITGEVEKLAIQPIAEQELLAAVSYSGIMHTATEPLFGDHLGQAMISLAPDGDGIRDVATVIDEVEAYVGKEYGDATLSIFTVDGGPPVGQPVSLKVRGQEFAQIVAARDEIKAYMEQSGHFSNINSDFKPGTPEMRLALDGDAIQRSGLHPITVTRSLQSFVDGELVTQYQHLGEEVDVRLISANRSDDAASLLSQTIANRNGDPVALDEVLTTEYGVGYQNIRHYNFLRAVSLGADIETERMDEVTANNLIAEFWKTIEHKYPGLSLDFSGALDDIQESLDGMAALFAMGIGLIYLILGTQFRSYGKPLIVIFSVPMAFCGVVYGLVITQNPMSLYTLYGVVALSGIAVNAAIVLISAANERLESGMNILHATIFAARRRVIPILITSFTTIAGLFSLAAGFAGQSLIWGPVATAIISGLLFSTLLILIVVPLLYRALAGKTERIGRIFSSSNS